MDIKTEVDKTINTRGCFVVNKIQVKQDHYECVNAA